MASVAKVKEEFWARFNVGVSWKQLLNRTLRIRLEERERTIRKDLLLLCSTCVYTSLAVGYLGKRQWVFCGENGVYEAGEAIGEALKSEFWKVSI